MQMRMMRNMELQKNKVLLGLSGGVDSATAALLLKEKGFNVTGFYFDVKGQNEQGRAEAEAVAKQLDIPLIYDRHRELHNGIPAWTDTESLCPVQSEYQVSAPDSSCQRDRGLLYRDRALLPDPA